MRRRPIGPRRPGQRPPIRDIPRALQLAHELMLTGEYDKAARAFEQMARGAQTRGGPRAAQLYLQAGRARLLNQQVEQGVPLLKQGLELLAARLQWRILKQAGERVISELEEQGLADQAGEIAQYLQDTLPELPETDRREIAKKRPVLPMYCPGCGGAIRPDEVEWLDEHTVECDYCGSPVHAEG